MGKPRAVNSPAPSSTSRRSALLTATSTGLPVRRSDGGDLLVARGQPRGRRRRRARRRPRPRSRPAPARGSGWGSSASDSGSKPPVSTTTTTPPAGPRRLAGDAVAGHARKVVGERPPRAGEAVEQRRLADVRATDDGDGRRHIPTASRYRGGRPRFDTWAGQAARRAPKIATCSCSTCFPDATGLSTGPVAFLGLDCLDHAVIGAGDNPRGLHRAPRPPGGSRAESSQRSGGPRPEGTMGSGSPSRSRCAIIGARTRSPGYRPPHEVLTTVPPAEAARI